MSKTIQYCTLLIAILAAVASSIGIFSNKGPGPYEFRSIRGEDIKIYGKGAYKDMSAEVAPQGIAQDVITLFIGVPLLLISLAGRGNFRGKLLLAGTLGYFLVTYLFFVLMAMYNHLFVLWVILLGLSFFSFISVFTSIDSEKLKISFTPNHPVKFIGCFLIFNSIAIAFLWLSIVIPPLIHLSIPKEVEHYTTLVVQALDLGILLPAAFIAGFLLIKKTNFGYLLASVYIVFLTLLMTALSAKVIAMALLGYNVVPVIFIIPAFNLLAFISLFITLRNAQLK